MFLSEEYLDFIRSHVSLYSGRVGTPDDPIVAAHQSFGDCRGTGIKSPDTYAVPLLYSEHLQEHLIGKRTFWGEYYEALPLRCLEYVTEYLEWVTRQRRTGKVANVGTANRRGRRGG